MANSNFAKQAALSILVSSLLFSSTLQAQRMLPLDDAISMAVAHSKQLQLDSIQLQLADSRLIQSKNAQLPQVNANLSYIRISDNITPFKVAFPTGEVTLNPQILNQYYNSVQVRQLIWGGGKARYGNELRALDKKTIYFDLDKNKADISYTITTLWYNLFTVKQSRKIVEANIELLTNQKKDADNFVQQGILLANDVLKIELAITNLQSDLSDIVNTQKLLKYNLCLLTGLDTKTAIDVPDALPVIIQQGDSLDQYLEKAVKNRAELKGLSIRKEQATVGLKISRSNYLPTLSVGGTVNYDQPNQRLFPNQATITGTWNAGVFLNWNLTDLYTTKQRVRESKLSIENMSSIMEQATEGIQIEVNEDYNNYLQARQKIEIANKALAQATENFRVEQNRFQTNTTTPTDFLNANILLTNAKINLITSTANAELAYRKLIKSTN
ncbi:MAG: TolC family protein [Chitinophagaceae bacterium]|nr:TolC family protein [Chitinophagaceae bacterium]